MTRTFNSGVSRRSFLAAAGAAAGVAALPAWATDPGDGLNEGNMR